MQKVRQIVAGPWLLMFCAPLDTLDLKSIMRYVSSDGINWYEDKRYDNPLASSATDMLLTPHSVPQGTNGLDLYFGFDAGSKELSIQEWSYNLE